MLERTGEDWLRLLKSRGPESESASVDLREILRRGLYKSLASRPGVDDTRIEDWTQDALLKILQSLDSFRGESRFTTWAMTIAIRVAFTELRRARWKEISLERLVEKPSGSIQLADPTEQSDSTEKAGILTWMYKIMAEELTDRQRTALIAELRGMPQAEIAQQMGMNRNALYKLTHDARQKLKQGLEAVGITATEVRETFAL